MVVLNLLCSEHLSFKDLSVSPALRRPKMCHVVCNTLDPPPPLSGSYP